MSVILLTSACNRDVETLGKPLGFVVVIDRQESSEQFLIFLGYLLTIARNKILNFCEDLGFYVPSFQDLTPA